MPISTTLWHTWLTDPTVLTRFEKKRYRPSPTTCWHWLGAISSTGHGSFRAATLPGPPAEAPSPPTSSPTTYTTAHPPPRT